MIRWGECFRLVRIIRINLRTTFLQPSTTSMMEPSATASHWEYFLYQKILNISVIVSFWMWQQSNTKGMRIIVYLISTKCIMAYARAILMLLKGSLFVFKSTGRIVLRGLRTSTWRHYTFSAATLVVSIVYVPNWLIISITVLFKIWISNTVPNIIHTRTHINTKHKTSINKECIQSFTPAACTPYQRHIMGCLLSPKGFHSYLLLQTMYLTRLNYHQVVRS